MTLFEISVLGLWIVIFAILLLVLALARQVGVLFERVAPAGALMVNRHLTVGQKAPSFQTNTLKDDGLLVGQPNQLLFFLSPDCPICKTLLPALSGIRRAQRDLQIVLVSDGKTVEDHLDFVAEQKLDVFDYVISGEVGRGYGVGKLPYAVLIDEAGTVASLGMVNTREHLESLFEAKRLGVASIQEYLANDASQKLYEAK